MAYIQLDGPSLAFGGRRIFTNVQLTISPGSRISLTGANGSGKSTLMKVAAGLIEYDSGRVIRPKGTRVAYLPQSGIVHKGRSLFDEANQAFSELTALSIEMEEITKKFENNSLNQEALLQRYQEIHDILENSEWNRRVARIEQVLTGLGFQRKDFEMDVAAFSGGWQMRIALSKILLSSPDILLLDEPTNYLDLEAREWLRDFVKRYPGGIMLVSHDRRFLDETCNQVAEILMAEVRLFKKTFSEYEALREKEMAALVEKWKRQQEEIARIETFINRFRYKESKAIQVQSRIKMLDKIERIEIPPALKRVHLKFPEAPHCGKTVLRGEGLERRYGEKIVFSDLTLELPRGSRTAVTGINGAGKTTLLRIISEEDDGYSGKLQFGSGVKIGYFSQDQDEILDPSLTVIEEASRNSGEGEGRLRSLLGAFLFSGDDIHKKVEVLSGGEKSRLALLKILLEPVNLLILDEPTNHLDITSKDILIDALSDFGGTLVIVSHDRYFLERIADRVLEIKDGKGRLFLGDYSYYRWRTREETGADSPVEPAPKLKPESPSLPRAAQKKRKAQVAKFRKEEERLAVLLGEKESMAAELRLELEKPENYSDPDKARVFSSRLRDAEEQIEEIAAAWEVAATALEEAKSAS